MYNLHVLQQLDGLDWDAAPVIRDWYLHHFKMLLRRSSFESRGKNFERRLVEKVTAIDFKDFFLFAGGQRS